MTSDAAEPPSTSGSSSEEPEPSTGPDSLSAPHLPADADLGLQVTYTLDTSDTEPPSAGWLDEQLAQAVRLAGVTSGNLAVTLIDDPTMIQLHADHCDDPTPTDVLTFDLADREPPRPGDVVTHIDGDLVICREEAERQSSTRGHDARTELLLYAVHGLMHLLGEDDHDEHDYQRMHQREDQLLTDMGFGPVFHGQTETPGDHT
ncbi:rRNA maturation RNase YbeY [Algisphaera agarilytica]|uniref:Endoribonuclease YbeY n=1 Tax=Algisphaera agarilytica TaxID=1385975 RepID=A0A7X0HA00_9BACT|nr:rRNA maturation RNase YbeY [Algisphaera agarilytica]MBB6430911.1 putative rRNA maturation factor [Algisphaera agarilytica]